VSAALAIVDAEGILPVRLPTDEKFLEVLNLLSEPRLENRMESIDAAISDVAIWGFCLASVIFSIKLKRSKYLLEYFITLVNITSFWIAFFQD